MGKGGIDVELPNPWTLNINPNITLDVIDSIDTNTNAAVAMSIPEIDTIDTNVSMSIPEIDTINANLGLAITEPINANLTTHVSADMAVDVKPVVLDLCLTLGVKELPRVCISRPYDRSFNVTILGVEVFGFRRRGERKIVIDDLPKQPFVAVGGEEHRQRQHHKAQVVGDPGNAGLRISVG